MTAIGGSLEVLDLAGREFPATADADAMRGLGGDQNEVQANGNGTARLIKLVTPWHLNTVTIQIDDSNGDAEYIQDLADGNDFFPIGIVLASGITYQATGQLVAELDTATQATSMSVSLMGGGKLTPQ